MGNKAIFWGQPSKNNVVRPGEFIVSQYTGGRRYKKGDTMLGLPLLTDLYRKDPTGGAATFSRNSGATVTDFEGNVKTVKVDEARFVGARRVENLNLGASNDFTDSEWKVEAGVAFVGKDAVDFNGTGGFYTGITITIAPPQPQQFRLSCEVRTDDGDGSLRWAIGTGLPAGGVLPVTSTWTRVAFLSTAISASPGSTPFYVQNAFGDFTGKRVYFRNQQSEIVTNQSNQAPSEFVDSDTNYGANVDGVRYFDYLNASSVDANGVVTEAAGAAITDIAGLLVEEESTNQIHYSNDISMWEEVDGANATDYQTVSFVDYLSRIQDPSLTTTISVSNTFSCEARSDTAGANFRFMMGSALSADIPVTTGWVKYEATLAPTAATLFLRNGSVSGAATIQFRNIQAEVKPYATSIIPTSGAAATRLADDAQVAFPTGLVNDFVLGMEAQFTTPYKSYNNIYDTGASTFYACRRTLSGNLEAYNKPTMGIVGPFPSDVTYSYKQRSGSTNGAAVWVDGNKLADQPVYVSDITGINTLYIGRDHTAAGRELNGTIRNVNVINGDLTDEEVENL